MQVLEQYLPARHAAALIGEAKLLTARAPPDIGAIYVLRPARNMSVGLGPEGHVLPGNIKVPLVGLATLLRDRYGAPPTRLSVLKIDIERTVAPLRVGRPGP